MAPADSLLSEVQVLISDKRPWYWKDLRTEVPDPTRMTRARRRVCIQDDKFLMISGSFGDLRTDILPVLWKI